MIIQQKLYVPTEGWRVVRDAENAASYDIVIVFGSTELLSAPNSYADISKQYPGANIVTCSTAGEIMDTQVYDETLSLTAIKFEKTAAKPISVDISNYKNSFEAGYHLASTLEHKDLASVIIFSDGQKVNGSDLVSGLQEFLPKDVILTGGLAGDGARFQKTLVGLNNPPTEGCIVAIGLYGANLSVTYGSVGGWDAFGPERLITKSEGNVLYELDGKPALDIYKAYLGEYANELPSSGLLFPLSIRTNDTGHQVVRTILSVSDTDHTLTFAGNMPEGCYAQLMKANLDRLIDGASNAASNSLNTISHTPELAILVSCVGRKLVLDQRIEEEVEVIRSVFGDATAITGFYSYGEISPSFNFLKCELHNQTMTITTLKEL